MIWGSLKPRVCSQNLVTLTARRPRTARLRAGRSANKCTISFLRGGAAPPGTQTHWRRTGGLSEVATRRARRQTFLLAVLAAPLACVCAPGAAWAQRSTDSAVARAEDAFGGAVGQETVGIYTDTDVRGFNPQKAGNTRMDEVYFDQLATVAQRMRASYTIRVGFAALGDASPAPSGIVAYRARQAGDEFRATVGINRLQYGGRIIELDTEIPIVKDRLSLSAGLGLGQPRNVDGSKTTNYPFGFVPRLRFADVEIKPFISGFFQHDVQTRPLITTTGPFLPPMTASRRYLGQDWAANRIENYNNGVVGRAEPAPGLLVRGGFVQSRIDRKRNFTEIFAVRDPAGLAAHRLLADPRQNTYSNSWEAFVSYRFGDGAVRHTLHADVRSRHRHIESGGSQVFDFGDVRLGVPDPEAKPSFTFGALNIGALDQRNYSVGYKGVLKSLGQVSLGVTRSDYMAEIRGPAGRTRSSADPWLYNASLLVRPTSRVALYAGYVSGLEDNGAAPENAANRNQQLPASRTSQVDAGVQWSVARMRLVATVFEMKKPYFSFDPQGRFVELGDLTHRGVELSATGHLTERLHVLAGAIMMDPSVSGEARDRGLIGPRPVGAPKLHTRLDATYRTDLLGGLKLTFGMQHDARRAASGVGYAQLGGRQLYVPAHTTYDLGVRHNFTVGETPVSLRATINNILDQRAWKVLAANTFQLDDVRRFNLFLIADF